MLKKVKENANREIERKTGERVRRRRSLDCDIEVSSNWVSEYSDALTSIRTI